MGMTITEKILARSSSKKKVSVGEIVLAKPDIAVNMDTFFPFIIKALNKIGIEGVWDPNRVIVVFDHKIPADSVNVAEMHKTIREFVKETGIKYFYDVGRGGISHQLMAEKGHARPGMLYVADDTHAITLGALGTFAVALGFDIVSVLTTGKTWFKVPESIKFNIVGNFDKGVMSRDLIQRIVGDLGSDGALYKVMEFDGPTVGAMSIDGRMTMCNAVNNAGAKTGIVNPDQKTIDYVKRRTKESFDVLKSDKDAEYTDILDYDVTKLEPQVTLPPTPVNVKSVVDVENVEIDQAYIGSCASGRMEDLRVAARILKGKRIHPRVRMFIVPSSQEVYQRATNEGLIEIFGQSSALVCAPSCGPCAGYWGTLAAYEVCVATSVLNTPGRMGSHKSQIYLASAATVASSAIEGKICDPRGFM